MAEPIECVNGVCLAPKREEEEKSEDNPPEDESNNDSTKEDQPQKKKHASKKKHSGSANPSIHKIHTQQEMDSLLSSNEAVIVEFMTSWCGACKGIEPLWEELATEHIHAVACAQVVCDKNKETKKLATAFGVKSYPVFAVFENGNNSQKWNGADRGKLEETFEKLGGGGGGKKGGKGGKKKGRR